MADARIYSPSNDGDYDFDNFDYFLTADQIDCVVEKLNGKLQDDIIDFIRQKEAVKRRCCNGEMNRIEMNRTCAALEDSLTGKVDCWAYQTPTYRMFYHAVSER